MSIAKNFIYNFMYQLLTIIMPIITVPYISRVLGAEGIGKYAYTNAYVQYFILIGMVGLSLYSNRQIAYVRNDKKKLNETFWELSILRFAMAGISLIFYIIIFLVINKHDRLIYTIQGLNILSAAIDISWLFMGLEDFKKTVTRNTYTKIIGVALIFLLVKRKDQIWLYILILTLSQFVGQLVMWKYVPKFVTLKNISVDNLYKHLKISFKIFIPQLAVEVYTLLDRSMLGLIIGEREVGIYDNSQKIIRIILSLLTSLATVMMPYMSNLFISKDVNRFKENIKKAFSFTSFIAIPMAFGLVAIARSFVPWFYGKEFAQIQYLLYIGSWMMIAIAWSSVLGLQIMIPMKKENLYTISVTVSAVINVILNIFLIPILKSTGTTISTVVAEFTGTIIQLYLLRDFIKIKELFKGLYRYIFASFIMLVFIKGADKFLKASIGGTLIEVIIGMLTYFVIMLFFKDQNLNYILKKITDFLSPKFQK